MTRRIGFFVPPGVSLLGLDCAIDTLRAANRYLGWQMYHWCTIGQDDGLVTSTNGLRLALDHTIEDPVSLDMLFVCGWIGGTTYRSPKVEAWLRRMAPQVEALGGLTAGAFLLARAGLLDGYTCTTHWEDADTFRQMFPDIPLSDSIFVIDRNRMTSAGGLVSMDLFMQIVARDCGARTTLALANSFQLDRLRSAEDRQTWSLAQSARPQPKQILRATSLMEATIDAPLPLERIAEAAGLSVRQLHRVFLRHLRQSPSDVYRRIRLRQARHLMRSTSLPVIDVAVACGFASQSAFSRSYLRQYGHSPSADRRRMESP
ncbi:MAG: GlxA family transcriptional regulator [Paracoccaceae bacterium]